MIDNGAVSREGGRLSVRTAIPKTILMVLGCVLLAAPSAAICAGWLLTLAESSPGTSLAFVIFSRLLSLPIFLICVAGVLLFGGGLVFFLGRLLFFRRPILEVDSQGILERASAVSVGFLRWEEVKDVSPANVYRQRYISIRLWDEHEVLARQNPLKRMLMRLNRRYFTKTIANVPMNMLAIKEEELLAEIQPHLPSPAGERLAKILEKERAAAVKNEQMRRAALSRSTPSSTALLIAKAAARWIVGAVLSLVYLTVSIAPLMFGALLAWNGMSPGTERDASQAHPVAGAILIVIGVLAFIFFPRLCQKLTGIEPLSGPFRGS